MTEHEARDCLKDIAEMLPGWNLSDFLGEQMAARMCKLLGLPAGPRGVGAKPATGLRELHPLRAPPPAGWPSTSDKASK